MNVNDAIKITKDELLDSCTDEELEKIDDLFKSYDYFYQNWHMDAESYKYMNNTKLDLTVKEFLDDYEKELKEELKNYDVNKDFDERVLASIDKFGKEEVENFCDKSLNPKVTVLNENVLLVEDETKGKDTFLGHKDDLIDYFKNEYKNEETPEEGEWIVHSLEEEENVLHNDVVGLLKFKGLLSHAIDPQNTAVLVSSISWGIFNGEIEKQYENHKQHKQRNEGEEEEL